MPKIRGLCNLKHIFIARNGALRFLYLVSDPWKFIKSWLPTLLWMVVIFSASADPQSFQHSYRLVVQLLHWLFPQLSPAELMALHHGFRKGAHLTEYAILALLLRHTLHKALAPASAPWTGRRVAAVLAVVFFYAISDEFHQSFVPGRTPLFTDVLIDTSGGCVGLLAGWWFYRVRKKS